jgi:hypothetical protein
MPEAVEVFFLQYEIEEGYNKELDNLINDRISSIYSLLMNLFSMFAPIIGGLMYDSLDYNETMHIHIFIELGCAVIYILFNCGCNVC